MEEMAEQKMKLESELAAMRVEVFKLENELKKATEQPPPRSAERGLQILEEENESESDR